MLTKVVLFGLLGHGLAMADMAGLNEMPSLVQEPQVIEEDRDLAKITVEQYEAALDTCTGLEKWACKSEKATCRFKKGNCAPKFKAPKTPKPTPSPVTPEEAWEAFDEEAATCGSYNGMKFACKGNGCRFKKGTCTPKSKPPRVPRPEEPSTSPDEETGTPSDELLSALELYVSEDAFCKQYTDQHPQICNSKRNPNGSKRCQWKGSGNGPAKKGYCESKLPEPVELSIAYDPWIPIAELCADQNTNKDCDQAHWSCHWNAGACATYLKQEPSLAPTHSPTISPTNAPSTSPTVSPTSAPSTSPTAAPSMAPSMAPSLAPTPNPATEE